MGKVRSEIAGRYRLVRPLGKGGTGRVWLVRDELLDKEWAAKILPRGRSEGETETDMLKLLSHPRLPRIVDIIEDAQNRYLIMDYIEGQTLDSFVKSGKSIPDRMLLRIGADLAGVLIYLHAMSPPVLHRDLKPGNVIIRRGGEAMLVDFGAAWDGSPHSPQEQCGTPGFAAPEQYGPGGRADERSDIYSLGKTLLAVTDPDASGDLKFVLKKASEKRPSLRYQTAADFRDALLSCRENRAAGFSAGIRHACAAVLCAAAGTFLLLAGSACRDMMVSELAGRYAMLLSKASDPDKKEDAADLCMEAIDLLPARREAYLQYLHYMKGQRSAGEGLAAVCARISTGSCRDGELLMRIGEMLFAGDGESGLNADYYKAKAYFSAASDAGVPGAEEYAVLSDLLSSFGREVDWAAAHEACAGISTACEADPDPEARLGRRILLAEVYNANRRHFKMYGIDAVKEAAVLLETALEDENSDRQGGRLSFRSSDAWRKEASADLRKRAMKDLAELCLTEDAGGQLYNPDRAAVLYGQLAELSDDREEREGYYLRQAEAAGLV